jgi:hypothetical protein
MKLTIEVTLQGNGFDKMRSRVVIEQPCVAHVIVGQTINDVVMALVNDALYKSAPETLPENEQLGLPPD